MMIGIVLVARWQPGRGTHPHATMTSTFKLNQLACKVG